MAGKKKKGKKKKKGGKKAGPAKLILPNFVPVHRAKMPQAIHVHHLDDMFLIYSDEYDESQKIIDEISKILNVEPTDLRLYFSNKRRVELDTVNHDQQIVHNCHLYLVMKKEEQWENVRDIIGYNIYDVNLDEILEKEEEEKKLEEEKQKQEEERKKKEAADRNFGRHRKKNY